MVLSSVFQTLTSGIVSVKPLLSVICGVLDSEFVCLTSDSHALTGHMKYLKASVGVNSFLAQLKSPSAHKSFLLLYMRVKRDYSRPPLPLDMQ